MSLDRLVGAKIIRIYAGRGISYPCGGDHDILYIETDRGLLEIQSCRSRINVHIDGHLVDADWEG